MVKAKELIDVQVRRLQYCNVKQVECSAKSVVPPSNRNNLSKFSDNLFQTSNDVLAISVLLQRRDMRSDTCDEILALLGITQI